jgi:serine protease
MRIKSQIARRFEAAAAVTCLLGLMAIPPGALGAGGSVHRNATSASIDHLTAPAYAPHRLIVGYRPPVASAVADIRAATRMRVTGAALAPSEQVIDLPPSETVSQAAAAVRRTPGVAYAVPDYLAHAAGGWYPNDRGRTHHAGGWERLQWNFLPAAGVNAPEAWANLIAAHRPGARGVTVAILDTGVAYRDWRRFRRSPDFRGTRFVAPCDLVAGRIKHNRCTDPNALDREGHGTFVAGTLAEATNNRRGLTGLAYGASIMPIRVLDSSGLGDSSAIAQGIRYAVRHGAKVINLSLEFYVGVTSADIPDIISAIRYAHAHGVIVVAAAGNDGSRQIAYPARAPSVISVGATTKDRCLAAYSDVGQGLSLVAPGGGDDSGSVGDPQCHPDRNLPDVYQMTFNNPAHPGRFSLPGGWYGTSMAAPDVSAAAAMVIASGVIGAHPTPDQVLQRLEKTAVPLGSTTPNRDYGYGLVDIGAATAPTP